MPAHDAPGDHNLPLLDGLKVEYCMDADSSDSADECLVDAFHDDSPDNSLSLPKSLAVAAVSKHSVAEVIPAKPAPATPKAPLHEIEIAAPPPPPKRGDWWLTRTNRISNGCSCGKPIKENEFRLIYCVHRPELALKAPSYAVMHGKLGWKYHHLNFSCLPAPSATSQVEEVTGRDSIFVEVNPLAKRFEESAAMLLDSTQSAVRNALQQLRLAGHNVHLGEYS